MLKLHTCKPFLPEARVPLRESARDVLRTYPKTDGDCADFAEPAQQDGTVPFSPGGFRIAADDSYFCFFE